MRIVEIDSKLKTIKQRINQFVHELITYVEELKTRLFEPSKKYQKYFHLFHALTLSSSKDDVEKEF